MLGEGELSLLHTVHRSLRAVAHAEAEDKDRAVRTARSFIAVGKINPALAEHISALEKLLDDLEASESSIGS